MCAAGQCQNVSSPLKHPLTPKSANGPSQRASWATRHLSLLASVCGVLQPPLRAFSSANRASSSGVAPPVTNVRISVRMLSLKYVWGKERRVICRQMPLQSQVGRWQMWVESTAPVMSTLSLTSYGNDWEMRRKEMEDYRRLSVFSVISPCRQFWFYSLGLSIFEISAYHPIHRRKMEIVCGVHNIDKLLQNQHHCQCG